MESNEHMSKPPNRLASDGGFKNKTLLITGGSGFMGKVLIEKMLRTCPTVKKIYVIIRTKKGKKPNDRLKEIFSSPLYDLLKQTRGENVAEKVVAIEGDVLELGLGLSQENRQKLIEEVEIIYHMSATIRFDDSLKKAVLLNVRATRMMLDLAKECRKLLVFVHVSTAYCQLHERVLYEKAYPPPANPDGIIRIVEEVEENVVNAVAKGITGNYPNAYAFTKALGEGLVNNELDKLPIIIVRPSVVIPIWKEPIPGWTDNIFGPVGLLLAAGKGVLRTMYCNSVQYADFLPVDIAANAIMLATYDYLTYKKRQIYNLTSSFEHKITWSDIIETAKMIVTTKLPLNWVVWYPGGSMKSSRLLHYICVVLFHYIPAIIVDSLLVLTGNKPILWKVQQKITSSFEVLEFYANNQWDFSSDGVIQIREWMNQNEKNVYRLEGYDFNLDDYIYNCIHSLRLFILKEGDETIPTARRHTKMMWAVDKIFKIFILFGFGYLMLKYIIRSTLPMNI